MFFLAFVILSKGEVRGVEEIPRSKVGEVGHADSERAGQERDISRKGSFHESRSFEPTDATSVYDHDDPFFWVCRVA